VPFIFMVYHTLLVLRVAKDNVGGEPTEVVEICTEWGLDI